MRFDPGEIVSIDTETTGLRMFQGDMPFAVSMCNLEGETFYCEWPIDPFTRHVQPRPAELEFIRAVVENPKIAKVFHNAAFDLHHLEENYGIQYRGTIHETKIAARCANNNEPSYGLKPLAAKYVQIPITDEKELQDATVKARREGKRRNYRLAEDVAADYWLPRHLDPKNAYCEAYARTDAERTLALWCFYEEFLAAMDARDTYDLEMQLWHIVYRMEKRGVRVDLDIAREEERRHTRLLEAHRAKMFQIAGREFNPNSPGQLAQLLYAERKLTPHKTTPAGGLSTDAKALRRHYKDPLVWELLEVRANEKAISTFFSAYIKLAARDPLQDGGGYCIHSSFDQAGTVTGRFSSRDPNLQQASKSENAKGTESVLARKPFGPRKGYVWLPADYSQVELRIFADFSRERTMLAAMEAGRDIHSETANKVWGGDTPAAITAAIAALELRSPAPASKEVAAAWKTLGWTPETRADEAALERCAREWLRKFSGKIVEAEASLGKKTMRSRAKNINFAKIYGGGPASIMDLAYCTYQEAAAFMEEYDRAMPGIAKWINEISDIGRKYGYIRTAYNRRLSVPAERAYVAANYRVQGSAADLMKDSMRRLDAFFTKHQLDAHLVMTIHDEIVMEIRESQLKKWILYAVRNIMEDHGGRFGVPLPVEVSIARASWEEKEKVDL